MKCDVQNIQNLYKISSVTLGIMRKTNVLLCLLLFCLHNGLDANEFTSDRKRVGAFQSIEHMCLEKFKISENTIIRTQDSTALGAKFLNESDTGNREDCYTLCCKTDSCNVAVFEEKSPFSCYMFDCGTVDNFLCKFTSHTYYTSAVLAISRQHLDLGAWSKQHKHETDLTNLRVLPVEDTNSNSPFSTNLNRGFPDISSVSRGSFKDTTMSPSSKTTNQNAGPDERQAKLKLSQETHCSRFEFECHSGECIAIYNACDGVPQCKDGSDEDKSCLKESVRENYGTRSGARYAADGMNNEGTGASVGFNKEEGLGYGGHGRGPGMLYDYSQRLNRYGQAMEPSSHGYHSDYNDYSPITSGQHPPHQQVQRLQPMVGQGHQLPLGQVPVQMYPSRPDIYQPRPAWHQQPLEAYQNINPQVQIPLQQVQGLLGKLSNPGMQPLPVDQIQTLNEPREYSSPTEADRRQNQQRGSGPRSTERPLFQTQGSSLPIQQKLSQNPPPSKLDANKTQNSNGERVATTKASESKINPLQPSEDAKAVDKQLVVPAHSSLSRLEVDLKQLQIEAAEQSKETSGAVLALSLGLCITAMLMVLVGCRLRGMKRRMRRHRGGRSALEHDSDYLVNGMYL